MNEKRKKKKKPAQVYNLWTQDRNTNTCQNFLLTACPIDYGHVSLTIMSQL